MAFNNGFDPTAPPKPYDPNDPTLDLTNPGSGNRGSGAATSSATSFNEGNSYDPTPPDTSSPGPVASAPLPTQPTTPAQGNPATGGFIVPPGSLPPPTVNTNQGGLPPNHTTDDTFGQYSSDPVVTAVQAGLQSGMSGPGLIAFVQQRNPNAKLTWDASRGNFDLDLGGGNGLQFDQNAQGVWGVHSYDDGAGGSGSGSSGSGGTAAGTGGADIQGLLSQLLAGQDTGRQGAFFDQLQGLVGQYGQPVTADDPIIKAQTDAFGAAQTRGAQQGQAAQAEANAYRGIPTGTQDAATAQGYETAALNTGNFQANEMSNELNARRTQLQQTLSLYGGQLSAEQARQLQSQIAAINAQLSNQQMTNQNSQFYDQLGLTAGEQEALLNAQLIGAMSGSAG